jgi:hypothetical protein
MRKAIAWLVWGTLHILIVYSIFATVVCAFLTCEGINDFIDYGFDRSYSGLKAIYVAMCLLGSALSAAFSCFALTRQVRLFQYVAGIPNGEQGGQLAPPMSARIPRRSFSIRQLMAVVLVSALISGVFILNRRSRFYYKLSSHHSSLADFGHDGKGAPGAAHTSYHEAMSRKYFSLARFPLLPASPDPPEPN